MGLRCIWTSLLPSIPQSTIEVGCLLAVLFDLKVRPKTQLNRIADGPVLASFLYSLDPLSLDDVDLPLDANIFAVILKDEQLGSYKDHERLQVRNFAISSPSDWLHSLVAHSRSVFEYYSRHACCGKCGQPTIVVKGGHELTCSDRDDCKTSCFPRSDPVVIMLVVDPSNDSCLLGRQARWPPGLHSCLAGFMEHGEAAEEAVAREVVEESSVVVGQARYHSSQPWPFPYSLMLGFVARATQTAIQVDPNELESARWFSRKEVKSMLQGSDDAYKLPPKGTIAHELCTAFATDDPITMFD
eukprot:TRINITY_DN6605_c0_g1_i2.p1 TRINITY_DN6605_c0_g1~~TRINITY_DN6605_c0_g1_i2.p1  ORF type:complete len:300 (+),score=36.35 TRINITY_DN6605_c0_g1_i2:253-1152(+)